MSDPRYATSVDVHLSHADAIEAVTAQLAGQGFGILSTIDVKATLKKKLDLDVEPQTILGACNPKLASQALREEHAIGILLPCNVFVREVEPGVNRVYLTRAETLFELVDNPGVAPLAERVDGLLGEVAARLAQGA